MSGDLDAPVTPERLRAALHLPPRDRSDAAEELAEVLARLGVDTMGLLLAEAGEIPVNPADNTFVATGSLKAAGVKDVHLRALRRWAALNDPVAVAVRAPAATLAASNFKRGTGASQDAAENDEPLTLATDDAGDGDRKGDKTLERHYLVFISHSKADAGTEACAVNDYLKTKTKLPAFLDSEEEFKLSQLLAAVKRSRLLLILLTPNYVTRPYCVVELVTAFKSNIPIVSVSLARHGLAPFDFGSLMSKLETLSGVESLLNKSGWKVVTDQGFSKQDVRDALQGAIDVKAHDYHSHGPLNVRTAELDNVWGAVKSALRRAREAQQKTGSVRFALVDPAAPATAMAAASEGGIPSPPPLSVASASTASAATPPPLSPASSTPTTTTSGGGGLGAENDDDDEITAEPAITTMSMSALEQRLRDAEAAVKFLTSPLDQSQGMLQCRVVRSRTAAVGGRVKYTLHAETKDGRLGPALLSTSPVGPPLRDKTFRIVRPSDSLVVGQMWMSWKGDRFLVHDGAVDLAAVEYPVRRGVDKPREMKINLVGFSTETQSGLAFLPHDRAHPSKSVLLTTENSSRVQRLINKPPTWNESIKSWTLNFHGRATLPSNSNFLVVRPENQDDVVMSHGRIATSYVENGGFTLDLAWPLSPVQAFGIGVSAQYHKLVAV